MKIVYTIAEEVYEVMVFEHDDGYYIVSLFDPYGQVMDFKFWDKEEACRFADTLLRDTIDNYTGK